MTNSVSGSFTVPDNFIKEQIEGQLYHEDLGEDDEIWLIRMSSDIELSDVDRKKIWLSDHPGEANMKNIKTENGKILECHTENCEIPSLCVLLPQMNDDKLHAVEKVIKGTILISEGLTFSEDAEIKAEIKHEQDEIIPDSEPKSKKNKKKKKHSHNFENSDLHYETEDTEALISSKKQKKRVKKHSSGHKKSSSESVDIKSEPLAMDWDGFPSCVSQR